MLLVAGSSPVRGLCCSAPWALLVPVRVAFKGLGARVRGLGFRVPLKGCFKGLGSRVSPKP